MRQRIITSLVLTFLINTIAFGQARIPADSLKKHVYFLASDSLEGRGLATEGGLKAGNYIASYFKEIGLKPVGDEYFHSFYTRQGQTTLIGRNVVGMVEGSDPVLKDEYIVLGAHYDHIAFGTKNGEKIIYNGADDNATGTAAVIELGRALHKNRDKLKRSVILVAFDAEESGLLGSWSFVNKEIVSVEKIKFMMSIDMIGRYAETNSLVMGAMATLKGGNDILYKIANKHGIKIKRTGKKISSMTDSQGFGLSGIPALHVTSGITGPYHKPEDDPETIDYPGMEKIASLLFEVTVEVANSEGLKPIAKVANYPKNEGVPFFRYGLKANIGNSYHRYPEEFYRADSKFSAEVGLMVQLKLSKNLSIQPELLYSNIASDYKTGTFRLQSISVPVRLVLSTKMDKTMGQRFYASFGGYYSYHFSGKADGKTLNFTNDYEHAETGLVYGVGVEMMSVFISVNFKYGLSNLMQDKAVGEFMNRATYITLGYMF